MTQTEDWSRCNLCGKLHDTPICECQEKPSVCGECGKEFPYLNAEYCIDHLSDQDLPEYAADKRDCLEKAIAENRNLRKTLELRTDGGVEALKDRSKEIHDLKNIIQYLMTEIQENIDRTTELNIKTGEALIKLREKGVV